MGILLVIHVIVTILLIGIILIQKNEGGSSLFASSGASNGMLNARGTSNMLTKATWVLASIFLLNCILMAAISSGRIRDSETIVSTETSKSVPSQQKHENSSDKE